MNIKLLMVDLPLTKRSSPIYQGRIAEQLLKSAADVYCFSGYVQSNYSKFLEAFDQFDPFFALDIYGYGLLVLVRKQLFGQKVAKLQQPHLMHIRLGDRDDSAELIFLKILTNLDKPKYDDFKDRGKQFDCVLAYLDRIDGNKQLILCGNFNNGVINGYYAGKPRQNYNFDKITQELQQRGISITPLDGISYSYMGCDMKIDHLATRGVLVNEAAYSDLGIGSKHRALVATLESNK